MPPQHPCQLFLNTTQLKSCFWPWYGWLTVSANCKKMLWCSRSQMPAPIPLDPKWEQQWRACLPRIKTCDTTSSIQSFRGSLSPVSMLKAPSWQLRCPVFYHIKFIFNLILSLPKKCTNCIIFLISVIHKYVENYLSKTWFPSLYPQEICRRRKRCLSEK